MGSFHLIKINVCTDFILNISRYTCIARNTGGSAITAYNVEVIDIKRFYQIMR